MKYNKAFDIFMNNGYWKHSWGTLYRLNILLYRTIGLCDCRLRRIFWYVHDLWVARRCDLVYKSEVPTVLNLQPSTTIGVSRQTLPRPFKRTSSWGIRSSVGRTCLRQYYQAKWSKIVQHAVYSDNVFQVFLFTFCTKCPPTYNYKIKFFINKYII